MSESPSYDEFLADPAGRWRAASGAIPSEWAIQAARSSRAFREALQEQLVADLAQSGTLTERVCSILSEVFDAQDIAELFTRLTQARPPVEWAADFAKRFSR